MLPIGLSDMPGEAMVKLTARNVMKYTLLNQRGIIIPMAVTSEQDSLICCLWYIPNIVHSKLHKNSYQNFTDSKFIKWHINYSGMQVKIRNNNQTKFDTETRGAKTTATSSSERTEKNKRKEESYNHHVLKNWNLKGFNTKILLSALLFSSLKHKQTLSTCTFSIQ